MYALKESRSRTSLREFPLREVAWMKKVPAWQHQLSIKRKYTQSNTERTRIQLGKVEFGKKESTTTTTYIEPWHSTTIIYILLVYLQVSCCSRKIIHTFIPTSVARFFLFLQTFTYTNKYAYCLEVPNSHSTSLWPSFLYLCDFYGEISGVRYAASVLL